MVENESLRHNALGKTRRQLREERDMHERATSDSVVPRRQDGYAQTSPSVPRQEKLPEQPVHSATRRTHDVKHTQTVTAGVAGTSTEKKESSSAMSRGAQQTPRRRRRFDFIAFIGELLVTAGVILGLFAFWQVWITDMQVSSNTAVALSDFRTNASCPSNVSKDIRTDDPPVLEGINPAQTFGAMHIPRWDDMALPLKEGTGNNVLDVGAAGHYTGTVFPGGVGNFAVAAHRRSYGSSFRLIDKLEPGDPVIVETDKAWYVYTVTSHEIVLPSQGEVILPVPHEPSTQPTKRLMTMTTCHPEYGDSQRYIVYLEMKYWTPHDAGIPQELAEGGFTCM